MMYTHYFFVKGFQQGLKEGNKILLLNTLSPTPSQEALNPNRE